MIFNFRLTCSPSCQPIRFERAFLISQQDAITELINRVRGGDEAAFEEIVRLYSPRVFQIASRFFRQRSLVEEAAQDIFLKAYTQLADYEGRGSFEGWLMRIATNTCLNLLRSAKRRPEMTFTDLSDDETDWLENRAANYSPEPNHTTEDKLIAADLADKVLGTLSPDDRLAVMLVDAENHSVKEVSALTGWSESKVKVQAFRARRRLREAVEKLLKRKNPDQENKGER